MARWRSRATASPLFWACSSLVSRFAPRASPVSPAPPAELALVQCGLCPPPARTPAVSSARAVQVVALLGGFLSGAIPNPLDVCIEGGTNC